MAEGIELTKDEQLAKEFFKSLIIDGHQVPCDYNLSDIEETLPSWYDESLYKRGKNYFLQNKAGIMYSNLIGLICVLAQANGLKILQSTGRSSTTETARTRYLSTITHTFTWYDVDLSPGSKSFESLRKVRKLHYLSSKSAAEKGLGIICQTELGITTFGFMGFVLIRPQVLGIKADNIEDRKAFVHFWAVLCHMIGIQDRFNICLLPYDAVLVACQMVMRYVLLPIIQLETPDFKDMTQALLTGMKPYLYFADYEVDLFSAKQLLIVPGYQSNVDNALEVHCRSILTQEDVDECNKCAPGVVFGLSVDIPLIEVMKAQINDTVKEGVVAVEINSGASSRDQSSEFIKVLRDVMQLGPTEHVTVRYIKSETDWQNNLNDCKFRELSTSARFSIRTKQVMRAIYNCTLGRYLLESFVDFVIYRVKKANESNRSPRKVHNV